MLEANNSRCIGCSEASTVLGIAVGGLGTGGACAAVSLFKHTGVWAVKEVVSLGTLTLGGVAVGAIIGGVVGYHISTGCRGFSPGTLAEIFLECISGRNSRNRSCECPGLDCSGCDIDL